MADKRISQLVERTDIANNDVVPIVASGATTTNKATISSIQEFMQENLDLGVTSVGITLGTTGTDVSVTGSPITTSGNITINLPTASATNRGLLSSADWTTFNNKQAAGNYVTLDTAQTITAQKTFTTSGSSDTMIISHGSGSGFALDVIKAGNGEAIRVQKTSGSGNAMSVIGGVLSTEGISSTAPANAISLLLNGRSADNVGIIAFGANTGGGQYNFIQASPTSLIVASRGNTPLEFHTNVNGGGGPRMTISGSGDVTLTGALQGTSASFTGGLTTNANNFFNNTSGRAFDATSTGVLMANNGGAHNIIFGDGNVRYFSLFTPSGAASMSIRNFSTSTDLLTLASTGAATFSSSVGIGGSPTNRLTALASETGTQITTIPVAKFANTGNAFSKVVIGSDNANFDGVISMDNNATLANTKLRFYIGNGTNPTAGHSNDQIVLQGNGNVGIGTDSPAAKLEVSGTVRIQDTIAITSGEAGQAILTNNSTAVSVSTTTPLGGSFSMGGNGAFVIVYGADGSNVFIDTIIAANSGTPTVLSSTIVSGLPSLRTYSTASNRLQLAMASGTYNVRINILRQT